MAKKIYFIFFGGKYDFWKKSQKFFKLYSHSKFHQSQLETGWTDRDEIKEYNNALIKGNNIALKGPIFRLFLILVIANYHIPSFSLNQSRMTVEHSFFSNFRKIFKIDQNIQN
jgi:hypothetical protein